MQRHTQSDAEADPDGKDEGWGMKDNSHALRHSGDIGVLKIKKDMFV